MGDVKTAVINRTVYNRFEDDEYLVSLLVTQFANPGLTDKPLADDLQVRAAQAIERQWHAGNIYPEQPAEALIGYLMTAWLALSENEKVIWQARLVEACNSERD